MEKGFNDKELADIMSEIESLEREFATEEKPEAAAPQEVLQQLADTPVEKSVPKTNHDEPKVVPMKPAKPAAHASAPSSLTFKVEGEMTVALTFEVNGQTVSLEVTGDSLSIETESGAKFSLPMHAARKSA